MGYNIGCCIPQWLFCSYLSPGPSYSLLFWCILALPWFSTSRVHCMLGNSQNFWQRSFLPPLFSFKSTATPTYHRNFALVVISVVANSKICRIWSRNSSEVESQRYFVSERPFFQYNEQQAKSSQTKCITLHASSRKWTLSYRHAEWCLSGSH